jgi:colanic acid biosynthesis glycosyl transferase WcaI
MRVHIVSCVFPPEPVTSAVVADELATEMAERGHDVTVFAPFANRPSGKLVAGERRSWKRIDKGAQYNVIRSWHSLSKSSTLLSRLMENLSFGITSSWRLLRAPRADVVYVLNWPLFAFLLNMSVCRLRKMRSICVIKDLYPESFEGEGSTPMAPPLRRVLVGIDRIVYRLATEVTTLNQSMRNAVMESRQIDGSKVHVIPDWVDGSRFATRYTTTGSFRTDNDVDPDTFVAMYVGSLTRMAGLSLYVDAAESLQHRDDISILLVGDGAMRLEVEAEIERRELTNIRVVHPLLPEDVPDVQAAADVLLLSLAPGAAEHATPSKLLFYLFSGRAVVASVAPGSPAADLISSSRAGTICEQGSPTALAEAIELLSDNREALASHAKNARAYAEAEFAKSHALPKVAEFLESVANGRTRQHSP